MPFNTNKNNWITKLDLNSNRIVRDLDPIVAEVAPNRAGLFHILYKLGQTESGHNPKFEWFEREKYPFKTTASADAASSDTTISVDEPIFVKNDVIEVQSTLEQMLVKDVDKSAGTITVVRGYRGTTAQAITTGDYLAEIGNVNPEGGRSVDMKTNITTNYWNYSQIFKTAMYFTRNTLRLKTETDMDIVNTEIRRASIEHAEKIERALLKGKRYLDNTNFSEVARSTGGLLEFIQTNIMDISGSGGNLTQDTFDDWIVNQVLYYKNENAKNLKKIVLVDGLISKALLTWLDDKKQITDPEWNKYGIKSDVIEYRTPKGTVYIHYSSMLDEFDSLQGTAIAIDPSNIKIKYIDRTMLKKNIQANDEDAVKHQYLTDCGLKVKAEKTHAILKGVQTFS